MARNAAYGTAQWQRLRLAVLIRDGRRCRYCGDTATTADHVQPTSKGGAMWDLANLVAACAPCNRWKSDGVPLGRVDGSGPVGVRGRGSLAAVPDSFGDGSPSDLRPSQSISPGPVIFGPITPASSKSQLGRSDPGPLGPVVAGGAG